MGDGKSCRGDRRFITFAFSHSAAGNCFNPAPSILLSFANSDTASLAEGGLESSSRTGEEGRTEGTGSIIPKGRLGEDITCYLKKRITGDELRAGSG